jgi:KaiC/GvpD/RAD55 family RecA-like ATPase
MNPTSHRHSTGVPLLDEKLGGGLLPGTMTVLIGSTGIGKTQFGLQYAHAGVKQEGKRGIIFDMASRVDPQGHKEYADRLFRWALREEEPEKAVDYEHFWDMSSFIGDYFRALTYKGRRVTKRDLDFDQWNDWQAELSKHLDATIAYFFGHFVRGCRRCVIDGIEPVQHQGESIQFELLEYVYHQIIRKEADWVARDLFRQRFRENETLIQQHLYRHTEIGCLVCYTTSETLLDAMIEKPLDEGDLLASANTIIYLGKIRAGNKFHRAMYVSKHRGSVCSDEILPFDIADHGLRLLE